MCSVPRSLMYEEMMSVHSLKFQIALARKDPPPKCILYYLIRIINVNICNQFAETPCRSLSLCIPLTEI